jgi:hypothetical protein
MLDESGYSHRAGVKDQGQPFTDHFNIKRNYIKGKSFFPAILPPLLCLDGTISPIQKD